MLSKLALRPSKGLFSLVTGRNFSGMAESYYNEDHKAMQASLKKIIDNDINPNVEEWEKEGQYPAHEIFKKLGNAGLLGCTKPTEYGGQGLDFSFSIAFNEALGQITCGGVPMSIAVQTDMSTPALAKYVSIYLQTITIW